MDNRRTELRKLGARSIQPKFPEISVQNSMDRFGPTGKVSEKRVHLLRWTTFPGRTGWNFVWMDRALADVIGSNIVEKCDVTPARTIQLYTCSALQIFPHIFRLVCATFSPSFRHKFPLWWNHSTPSWRPTNRWWEIRPRDISFPSSLTTIVISQSSFSGIVFHSLIALVNCQSPVVQKVNNLIHWIFF